MNLEKAVLEQVEACAAEGQPEQCDADQNREYMDAYDLIVQQTGVADRAADMEQAPEQHQAGQRQCHSADRAQPEA